MKSLVVETHIRVRMFISIKGQQISMIVSFTLIHCSKMYYNSICAYFHISVIGNNEMELVLGNDQLIFHRIISSDPLVHRLVFGDNCFTWDELFNLRRLRDLTNGVFNELYRLWETIKSADRSTVGCLDEGSSNLLEILGIPAYGFAEKNIDYYDLCVDGDICGMHGDENEKCALLVFERLPIVYKLYDETPNVN